MEEPGREPPARRVFYRGSTVLVTDRFVYAPIFGMFLRGLRTCLRIVLYPMLARLLPVSPTTGARYLRLVTLLALPSKPPGELVVASSRQLRGPNRDGRILLSAVRRG
jgi:hypothetical protein